MDTLKIPTSERLTRAPAAPGNWIIRSMMAVILVGLFGNAENLFAGCARERHSVDEINLVQMTGFASGQLVLMPRCKWHYTDGMFKITFAVPRQPCNGPFCHVPQPNRDNDFRTVAELPSQISFASHAQFGSAFQPREPDNSEHVALSSFVYSSIDISPLDRPPISL